MTEADIEQYLGDRVKAIGGEVRKVQWVGRRSAPDRLVMTRRLPGGVWVELKHPSTGHLFPANPRERAQEREHIRMRFCGLRVEVIWLKDQVDALLA